MQDTSEPSLNFESQAYRDLISKSLLHKGHNARLKKAIEKTKRGEPVTIAYIGGSITQGAGAEPMHNSCYAYQSFLLFKKMFAPTRNSSLRFVKAGLGGTPSELGVIRYQRDVLREGTVQPDIVIVEFAVNDADDETEGICYESLVLQALRADNDPAVILLFSVFKNDWNLQDRLAPVGWHYNLPMVSVKDAVVEQFQLTSEEGSLISKEQYFHDIYHPTNAGHLIMADCLGWLFEVTNRSELDKEIDVINKSPLIGNAFVDVKLLDRLNGNSVARIDVGGFGGTDTALQMAEMDDDPFGTPHFPNNWMYSGVNGSGAGSFKMMLRSKRLILIFKDSESDEFGTANIRVDGELVHKADPHQINWTHCHVMILFDEKESSEHIIEIEMAEGHEDKSFTILGFGYVD